MLFVDTSFTTWILGFERAGSDRWLCLLFQRAYVPEFEVRFCWQAGDIAFWDNRATQAYVVADYGDARGVVERVAIAGGRPY
ncbi:alpha-ketoglutarate-dependent taurine dioxygenase [Streptomyces sp. V3I7]|nr:alpha-ketoglutarate-dependent taurine dioxygenase [Streptomyces sp. V3I7]